MRFITIRDLRANSAKLRKYLKKSENVVLTLNGKPIALIRPVSEETLEDEIVRLRRVRALQALEEVHRSSREKGGDKMSMDEINRRIARIRKERKRAATG